MLTAASPTGCFAGALCAITLDEPHTVTARFKWRTTLTVDNCPGTPIDISTPQPTAVISGRLTPAPAGGTVLLQSAALRYQMSPPIQRELPLASGGGFATQIPVPIDAYSQGPYSVEYRGDATHLPARQLCDYAIPIGASGE